jgi:hypothetical protein
LASVVDGAAFAIGAVAPIAAEAAGAVAADAVGAVAESMFGAGLLVLGYPDSAALPILVGVEFGILGDAAGDAVARATARFVDEGEGTGSKPVTACGVAAADGRAGAAELAATAVWSSVFHQAHRGADWQPTRLPTLLAKIKVCKTVILMASALSTVARHASWSRPANGIAHVITVFRRAAPSFIDRIVGRSGSPIAGAAAIMDPVPSCAQSDSYWARRIIVLAAARSMAIQLTYTRV